MVDRIIISSPIRDITLSDTGVAYYNKLAEDANQPTITTLSVLNREDPLAVQTVHMLGEAATPVGSSKLEVLRLAPGSTYSIDPIFGLKITFNN